MNNMIVKIIMIIILMIVAIFLTGVMIFAIIKPDSDVKISFLSFGDKTETLFQGEYDSNQINNIKIKDTSSNVKIKESNTDKIKVTVYGEKDTSVDIEVKENNLEITKENNIVCLISFSRSKEEILLEIPKNYKKEIQIKTSSGGVEVFSIEQANLQIETTSGSVNCGDMNEGNIKTTSGKICIGNAKQATLKATSGSISVENIGHGSLETSSGSVQANELEEAQIKTTSGSIRVEKANKITANTSSGSISIKDINSFCKLSCSSGSINIEACNITENSTMKTTSGSVKILHANNIYIATKTTSGSVKIEENDRKSEVELKIETTSGNIKVNK